MIKKFLQKVFNKKTKAQIAINKADNSQADAAKRIPAKVHKINKTLISQSALKTCEGLQKAGNIRIIRVHAPALQPGFRAP